MERGGGRDLNPKYKSWKRKDLTLLCVNRYQEEEEIRSNRQMAGLGVFKTSGSLKGRMKSIRAWVGHARETVQFLLSKVHHRLRLFVITVISWWFYWKSFSCTRNRSTISGLSNCKVTGYFLKHKWNAIPPQIYRSLYLLLLTRSSCICVVGEVMTSTSGRSRFSVAFFLVCLYSTGL